MYSYFFYGMYAAGRSDLTRPTALLRWHGRKLRGSPRRWQPPTSGLEYVVNVTNSGELARASKVVSAYVSYANMADGPLKQLFATGLMIGLALLWGWPVSG